MNYLIVLFKNNKKKKIINEFVTFERAVAFFDEYIKINNEIMFHKEFVNGIESKFELGLIQVGKNNETPIYLKDELGRNIKIKFDEENMSIVKITKIKIEEFLHDFQTKKKISFDNFIKTYISGQGIKLISGLNNKIVVQEDTNINIFLLKNQKESERFLNVLTDYFFIHKRIDCIVVKDSSTIQRKYLYELLEKKGFDKKFLYRQSTFGIQSE